MSAASLKREIEIIQKALKLDPNPNYGFNMWGEFNSEYLTFLSEGEQSLYRWLALKFTVINELSKTRQVPTLHSGDHEEFTELTHEVTLKILKAQHLDEIREIACVHGLYPEEIVKRRIW